MNLRSFIAALFAIRLCSRLSSLLLLAYSSVSEPKSSPNCSCDVLRMAVPWLEEEGEALEAEVRFSKNIKQKRARN